MSGGDPRPGGTRARDIKPGIEQGIAWRSTWVATRDIDTGGTRSWGMGT
ncbi:hypothetical protein [Sphaerisporangium album]|nr:hypothetical protein [Sphaerisporangium album]